MPATAVILLAHGSRLQEANDDVAGLAALLQEHAGTEKARVYHAFLQFGKPSLEEIIESCAQNGFKEILVLPLFLTSGVHITEDIPALMAEAKERYPQVAIKQCRLLGCDSRLVPYLWERAAEQL